MLPLSSSQPAFEGHVQVDRIFTIGNTPLTCIRSTINDGIRKVCTTKEGTFILSWSGRVYGVGKLGAVELTHFSTSKLVESQFELFDSGGFKDKLFKDIVGGHQILFLVSTENELFAIGQNDYAVTGQKYPTFMTSLTRIATFLDEDEYPVLVTACLSSTLVYTSKNRVFVMGQTSWFIGMVKDYSPLTYKLSKRLVSMSGGYFHANLLDEDGKVYVCGSHITHFNLNSTQEVRDMVPLDTIKERIEIAQCALNFSVLVTESQKVLLWGTSLPGNEYNNIPLLIELEIIDRLPMTIVTQVSSSDTRVIVNTNNGVYSNEAIVYNVDHYGIGSMTSQLKNIPNSFFERGFGHDFSPNMTESMKSSSGYDHLTFYTARNYNPSTIVRAFPRLFSYSTPQMILVDIEIITRM